jgi:hypothetical protein
VSTDLFRRYGSLLKEDGTNQLQRTLPALEEGYIRPDERSLPQLVEYAREVAEEVRYYNGSGQTVGDWRALLEPLLADAQTGTAPSLAELESTIDARDDWPPHVALFLVFLRLFEHLQDDLNELPRRHLRHYYERMLSLTPRQAVADDVHVVFELARNVAPTLLAAGTALDAGKDGQKRALVYQTRSETVVSAAQVAEVRRLVSEADHRGRRRFFVADAIGEDEAHSWPTFGSRQLARAPAARSMPEAAVGFAIASPVLLMGEGERSLRVAATLRSEGGGPPPLAIGPALRAELTGAEGWLAPDSLEARLVDNGADPMTLEMELALGEAAPAVVRFDPALHGEPAVSQWPVLRVLVRGESGVYDDLDGLAFESVDLTVTVTGLKDLVVQNEHAVLSPDAPMPLFGPRPGIGARFYVGSAEVFSKRLASLSLDLEWQDAPDDFGQHYASYFESPVGLADNSFLVGLDILYDRSWDHRVVSNESLFGSEENHGRTIDTPGADPIGQAIGPADYRAQPGLEVSRYDQGTKYGFIRLTLTGPSFTAADTGAVPFEAFGHKAFAHRYATLAVALSRFDPATDPPPEPQLPNEPYTPTLAGLTLGYTAEATADPTVRDSVDELYVIAPWGHIRSDEDHPARLVPELDGEAALFLGIAALAPPANLSLLFQIDGGTATAEDILEPGDTEWSYLAGKDWRRLAPGAVLADSTFGFQRAGLVVLSVGRDATTDHTAMPADRVWLRGLIRRPPESAARTREVRAQAALATFTPATGELAEYESHLTASLLPETIKRLDPTQAAIKKVVQPYASFGGRPVEADADFFRRSSERLRHRHRAVTTWDFERLVLEAFPEVFKIKCLPHSDSDGNPRAGEAALVIVPDLRSPENTDPEATVDRAALLEPRAGAVLMARIEDLVAAGLTTPFAAVNVIHPVYERLLVEARVAFQAGRDAGFYTALLDEELQRFLSPWAFEEGEDIIFGARVYRSEVLAFIEGREYVDYVTDFHLYHSYAGPRRDGIGEMTLGLDFVVTPVPRPAISEMAVGDSFVVGRGVEVAEASRPHAILVSQTEHRITPIEAGEDLCVGVDTLGIGYMTIGLDFEVHLD